MTKLDHALALAAAGFWVFPIEHDGKKPAFKGWQQLATRERDTIGMWFEPSAQGHEAPYNIGIYTGKFHDNEALLVLDIDKKKGKDGNATLLGLELAGHELPDTRGVSTPSGGSHLFFRVPAAVRQGANVLGPGVDVRSRGGYVCGPGSTIDGRAYGVCADLEVQPAPAWVVERCGVRHAARAEREPDSAVQVDQSRAVERGIRYLTTDAPTSVEGQGGDETAYKVAARLKDFGLMLLDAVNAMTLHWNERCSPPWPHMDLIAKVENAYRYGENAPGASAPEAEFKPVVKAAPELVTDISDPIERFNKEFAFVLAGGGDHILWQTVDVHGRPKLEHLNTESFHRRFSAERISFGNKTVPKTKVWMEDKRRRTYDGIAFVPGGPRDIVVKEDGD